MSYREQFYNGEIEAQTLLDVIDEKEAEAQALRDEVAALRAERKELTDARLERDELRARVVVMPERKGELPAIYKRDNLPAYIHHEGFNHCLDELARLNGKVVSEGLLRRILERLRKAQIFDMSSELERALLDEGKDVGDA